MKHVWQEPKAMASEAVLFTSSLAFVAMVAFGVAGSLNALFVAITTSAAVASVLVRWLFPRRAFFSLTFANLIAVYAAVFAFFMEQVFGNVSSVAAGIGFSLPVVAFLCGCLIWRESIGLLVNNPSLRDSHSLLSSVSWLLPISAVGIGVLLLSLQYSVVVDTSLVFLATMALIALIVLAVSQSVAIFLVDAGLLFDEFFQRMSRLAVPAFAFLTFYSLFVIAFASVYSIMSRHSGEAHFKVEGVARGLSFSEGVHFSIVTISTVGYGDIVPISSMARALASAEVVCGVMLLLFGVSELIEYSREHRRDRR
jgi:voltage-gated potassium channel